MAGLHRVMLSARRDSQMLTVMKRVLSEVRQSIRNVNPCKVEHFG